MLLDLEGIWLQIFQFLVVDVRILWSIEDILMTEVETLDLLLEKVDLLVIYGLQEGIVFLPEELLGLELE